MSGNIRPSGKGSWKLKFDIGRDPHTGKRRTAYHTFKGSKAAAKTELIRLMAAAHKGAHVDPSRITVAEFLTRWERDFAASNLSPKTLERFKELIRLKVVTNIGAVRLQKLRPADLAELYAKLQREGGVKGGPLAARTVGQVHRIIHRALGHAIEWGMVADNAAAKVKPPRASDPEIVALTVQQSAALLAGIKGRDVYPMIALALATGMRRGELCALAWEDVDFESGAIQVRHSLEQTGAGLRVKEPKSKRGKRSITLPTYAVAELRSYWSAQQQARLAAGLGKCLPSDPVFASIDGRPWRPDGVTAALRRAVKGLKLPKISPHTLRHTHASQLIAAGVDVLTLSRRLGHGSPSITLDRYGHFYKNTDAAAAAAMDKAFGSAKTE